MDQVLLSQPGRVAVLPEPVALPTVIRVAGFRPARAVITSISYSQDVAAQFLTTLQNVIYVYSVGDNIGTVQVSGVAFSSKCNDVRNAHGISDIFKEYDRLKLLANPRTITITIGDKAFLGLLIGIQVSTGDVQFGLMNYTLTFRILPEETHLRASQKQEPDYGQSTQETPAETTARKEEKPPKKEEDVDSSKDNQNNSDNNPNSSSSPSGSSSFAEDWEGNIAAAVNYVKETGTSIPVNSMFNDNIVGQAAGDVLHAVSPSTWHGLAEKGIVLEGVYSKAERGFLGI